MAESVKFCTSLLQNLSDSPFRKSVKRVFEELRRSRNAATEEKNAAGPDPALAGTPGSPVFCQGRRAWYHVMGQAVERCFEAAVALIPSNKAYTVCTVYNIYNGQ